MLLIDDILLFPVRGVCFIFREINNAVHQEYDNEADAIRAELNELYMLLETGAISEGEFDIREAELLDRLDHLEETEAGAIDESGMDQ